MTAHSQINYIQNGDFQTGTLSDWTVFLTSNGTLGSGSGLPNVSAFDVAGTGTSSDAAQFQAGEVVYNKGSDQGGGLSQTFDCPAGSYLVSADVAADNVVLRYPYNYDAGSFSVFVDGSLITSVDLGAINAGQILRDTLAATVLLGQGSHQISFEIARPWLGGIGYGATPLEYLDNLQVLAIPEPTSLGYLSLGVMLVCWRMKSPQKAV
ncbi:MAG TPA: hypothetical protein VNX46_11510 [Candidatus Acidoferrum sp.]|nr:hypothetical protein [Candidatus Acidoferrum sp.]